MKDSIKRPLNFKLLYINQFRPHPVLKEHSLTEYYRQLRDFYWTTRGDCPIETYLLAKGVK
jgi:hypothetical protein